ncbi:MAG: hypothetical protein KVP17_005185 [Porospora cf. gigantea B]|uniref:uncharacterized protein n=1 Tax=Porospora cf. gigantea B TaxID=2853592 RepID=UPI003571CEFD|nr:MAG: hypothetical protein KVP17_005185 [Porospora cf. gigantea B]
MTSLGLGLWLLGTVLLLDRVLLTLGNMAFMTGIAAIIGLQKTVRFFVRPVKLKGSLFFLGGMVLIMVRWRLAGFVAECYGSWVLFSSFLPNVLASVKLTPLGAVFELPGLRQAADWIYDQRRLPV